MAQRERERAEQALTRAGDQGIAVERVELQRREKRLVELERSLRERTQGLDAKESDLELDRVRWETESDFRELKLEERERAVEDLERRLAEKEAELATYVAQVQGELQRRELSSRP
jgi:hypothetical protein